MITVYISIIEKVKRN